MEDTPDWAYYPKLLERVEILQLLQEINPFCSLNGTGRLSFVAEERNNGLYPNLNRETWGKLPLISQLRTYIDQNFRTRPDYCLVHIYPDGNSAIAWHNDKEALNTPIFSMSFGASRKFRFRKIGQTKGVEKEFILNSGDLLLMKTACQLKYYHSVPQERKVKDLRINLTFRCNE